MASANRFVNVEERFAANLREALKARYGRVPSAAFIAIQFNRHNESGKGISQESTRRWLRGLSMPSYQNLQVLALWLGVEVALLIGDSSVVNAVSHTEHSVAYSPQVLFIAEMVSRVPPQIQAQILDLIRVFPYT